MLSELKAKLQQQIRDWQANCYGHVGLELGIKIRTLMWVIKQIEEMENGQVEHL
jgi:hypothetical protein